MKTLGTLLALALLACGGSQQAATTTTPEGGGGGAEGGAVVGPPQTKWKDMTHDQKLRYMKKVVLPTMKPLFAQFDAEKYGDMMCGTCHGDGVDDGTFKMPNPKLPKIPNSQEGFQKLMADHPKGVEFMMKTVKPKMAELLGLPQWDPKEQPDGFSCHGCHTAD